ncbi:MAG: NYN domain-containing protein [Phycisphaerales bacterium]|nr:NYN domain-containing protein [Phycisphaerales bacterium]
MHQGNRSIVYIDGFNLYYGAVRGGPHKWLDLQKYFTLLRQGDDLRRIYYFTAIIQGSRRSNQETYLRALEKLPLVEIRLGKFKNKTITCGVPTCTHAGRKRFEVPEEKQTDVAIGIQMLEDAFENRSDRFVIVSGDSDLLPAVHAIKRLFPPKKIIVYVPSRSPQRGAAIELRSAADQDRTLPLRLLKVSQFPPQVPDGHGGWICKPPSW